MPIVVVTPPSEEPVSLSEAKLHLRVDASNDDTLIQSLISAVRQHAEAITWRSLCTQTLMLVMDQFPAPGMNVGSANWYGPQWGTTPGPLTSLRPEGKTGFEIILERGTVQSVTSIQYTDENGTAQALDPAAYKVDTYSTPARIVPAYGTTWPATRNEINAVRVTYVSGYGAATTVPEGIKRWMLLRLGAMYENREEFLTGRSVTVAELPFVDEMLTQYRIKSY
jgi:Phage gp6-like head-tail connector protein